MASVNGSTACLHEVFSLTAHVALLQAQFVGSERGPPGKEAMETDGLSQYSGPTGGGKLPHRAAAPTAPHVATETAQAVPTGCLQLRSHRGGQDRSGFDRLSLPLSLITFLVFFPRTSGFFRK